MVVKCIGSGREIDQKDMGALVLLEEAWVTKSVLQPTGLEGKTVKAVQS